MHCKERIIICTLVVLLRIPGWAEEYPNRVVRQYNGLQFEMATDRYLYQPHETVRMEYQVKTLEDSLLFSFGSPPIMDVGLYDSSADSLLWYYANFWFGDAVFPKLTFLEPFKMETDFVFGEGSIRENCLSMASSANSGPILVA